MSEQNEKLLTTLQKADLTVQDLVNNGGYLNVTQQRRFMRTLIEQAKLLNMVRTIDMPAVSYEIPKAVFGSRVMHGMASTGSQVTPDADRATIGTSKVTLNAIKGKATTYIPIDTLEDNIEAGTFYDTILYQFTQRMRLDVEDLLINGDTSIAEATNDWLYMEDGLLKLATSNEVDHGGDPVNVDLFTKMSLSMPNAFKRQSNLVFLVSPNTEIRWRETVSGRQTEQGDRAIIGSAPVMAQGKPLIAIDSMPDSKVILTDPKNIIWGLHRKIKLETFHYVEAENLAVIYSLRTAVEIEEVDAVVQAKNVAVAA